MTSQLASVAYRWRQSSTEKYVAHADVLTKHELHSARVCLVQRGRDARREHRALSGN